MARYKDKPVDGQNMIPCVVCFNYRLEVNMVAVNDEDFVCRSEKWGKNCCETRYFNNVSRAELIEPYLKLGW